MQAALKVAGTLPKPQLRSLVCPYCGGVTADSASCANCAAPLDALSRQATQNQMGPWFVRDDAKGTHRPGCNYATIERMAKNGTISGSSVVRGPSTHQFWMLAKHTPGLAHLLGACHNCGEPAGADMFACRACGEPFSVQRDRQHMGLGPTRPLPGSARVELVAMHAGGVEGADDVSGPSLRVGEAAPTARSASSATPAQSSAAPDPEHNKELERNLRVLQSAWTRERRRAWFSFACALVVCALSLVVLWVS